MGTVGAATTKPNSRKSRWDTPVSPAQMRSRRSRLPLGSGQPKTPPPASKEDHWRQQERLDKTLRIHRIRQDQGVALMATNLTDHHITFTVKISTRNLKDESVTTTPQVLGPRQSRPVGNLTTLHPERPWHYHYHVEIMPGQLKAQHNDKAIYSLPYPTGTSHSVVQGYGGKTSHSGNNHYAIDFAMSRGSRVCAARAGIVAAIKSDSQTSGPTEDFLDYANFIIIEHADGTLAEYAHLKYKGVLVEVDQRVEQGQLLGYSGNTGYSKGPHLHFAVRQVISAQASKAIPVRFQTEEGIVDRLETYERYRAVSPASVDKSQ